MGEDSGLIFLTGGSGFIGRAFLTAALKKGWRIRLLSRSSTIWRNQNNITVIQGDLLDISSWEESLIGVDTIVHCAAEVKNKDLINKINYEASRELHKRAIQYGITKWLQLSSVGAYGYIKHGQISEEQDDNPANYYEKSKSEFDQYLISYSSRAELSYCILRPSIVYGNEMRNQSIRQLINLINSGLFMYIDRPGASANYIHVSDVVRAMLICIEKEKFDNSVYIVSMYSTLEKMVNSLAKGVGVAAPNKRMPFKFAKLIAMIFSWIPRFPLTLNRLNSLTYRSIYCTNRIEEKLGWHAEITVEEGMYMLARHYRLEKESLCNKTTKLYENKG